jgi:hypothetical protein
MDASHLLAALLFCAADKRAFACALPVHGVVVPRFVYDLKCTKTQSGIESARVLHMRMKFHVAWAHESLLKTPA